MVLGFYLFGVSVFHYRYPTVTGMFPSGFIRFRIPDIPVIVFVPGYPVSVSVRWKKYGNGNS